MHQRRGGGTGARERAIAKKRKARASKTPRPKARKPRASKRAKASGGGRAAPKGKPAKVTRKITDCLTRIFSL